MKFLNSLAKTYEHLQIEKPQWLIEYDGSVAGVPSIAPTQAVPSVPGTTPAAKNSVVDALMSAMDVLGNNPNVQKMKATVTKATTDAEKKIADTTNKVVSKINQTMSNLDQFAKTPTTTPSVNAPTVPNLKPPTI
ncbi:hypothetical protein EBR43_12940 [bacterium]|nr:hypothetical protein [bacterium]